MYTHVHIHAKGYPRGGRELLGALTARFSPADTHAWFSGRGVALKTEADGRVFPVSDRSSTITRALEEAAREAGVRVLTGCRVTALARQQQKQRVMVQQGGAATPLMQHGEGEEKEEEEEGGGERDMGYTVTLQQSSSSSSSFSAEGDSTGTDSNDSSADSTGSNSSSSSGTDGSKVLRSIDCDRVILATGSAR
jgi:hypothetical protein